MIVDRCIRTATLRSSKTGVTVRLEQEFRPNPAKQALSGPSATRTRTAAKRALSGPLVPVRQVMRRQRCLSSISAAESGGRLGTGCLAGRPLGVYVGCSLTVVG